jgi:Rab family, other
VDYNVVYLILHYFQGDNVDDSSERQKGLQDMMKNGSGSNGLGPFTIGSNSENGRCSC